MIPVLKQSGISVTYLCTTSNRLHALSSLPDACLAQTLSEVWSGQLPAQVEARLDGVDDALLKRLSPYESTALQMLDRLNYYGARVRDIRRRYLAYVCNWMALLRNRRPNAVLFQTIPHMGYDYVLYFFPGYTFFSDFQ